MTNGMKKSSPGVILPANRRCPARVGRVQHTFKLDEAVPCRTRGNRCTRSAPEIILMRRRTKTL
jgi:hypothetical protein